MTPPQVFRVLGGVATKMSDELNQAMQAPIKKWTTNHTGIVHFSAPKSTVPGVTKLGQYLSNKNMYVAIRPFKGLHVDTFTYNKNSVVASNVLPFKSAKLQQNNSMA